MANQLQQVIYEGYLVEDPVMRYTPQGQGVTNFRMGSNRSFKTADGTQKKETTWLKVTAWGKRGEAVNLYCAKGSHVIVIGKLRVGENGSPSVYQLKSGDWAASYEITADNVRILKGKDGATPAPEEPDDGNGDLPF
jgi:single-strand DNA-binding protein